MDVSRSQPASPPIREVPDVNQAKDARARAASLAQEAAQARRQEAATQAQNQLRQQINGQGQQVGTRLNEVA